MRSITLWILLCASAAGAWAQAVLGSGVVSGVVLESEESGMPDAEVIVENQALGVRRVVLTSLDGVFEATGLIPGPGYRVRVTHKRFLDWKSAEFEVRVGQRVRFGITMAPGGEAEAVETGATMPLVESTTESVGAVIGEREIDVLPTVNRRWDSLALLAPATAPSRLSGTAAVHGNAASNAYFTDGLLTGNTYSTGRAAPAGRVAQDAIQGLHVLTGGAPVEFGHAMGGAINAVTRSGGSQFHGGAYDYFSNNRLNSIDRYALGQPLSGKRNQTGFNLGGPILPSKLFFFSNLEISDSQGQGLNRITNPLIADATGTSVARSNCKATTAQCDAAIGFIEAQMNVLVPRSEHWVNGLTKIDYRRSDMHAFSLAVYATHSRSPLGAGSGAVAPDGGFLGGGATKQDTHYEKFEWVSAPGYSASNELRLGMFHERTSNSASASGLATGKAAITVAGVTLGEPQPDSGIFRERRFQLVDNFRVTQGAHSFLVGLDWTRTSDYINSLRNANGAYSYSSLTAFAQDLSGAGKKNYTQYTQTIGDPVRNLTSSEFSFYAQDAWRIRPNVQVTAGVRWGKPFLQQPTEAESYYYKTGYINSPNVNVDPRIGISYALGERTVLRASFGMFHAAHSGELIDALFLGNGSYQSSIQMGPTQTDAPLFPNALSSALLEDDIPTGTVNLMYADSSLRNPYTKQSTVTLERYAGAGVTVSASYIGSRGVKLWAAEDINVNTVEDATYTILDTSGRAAGTYSTGVYTARGDYKYAHVYQVVNGGSSWYRALALQVRKRMEHGFSARASYTYSHAIDDAGGARVAGGVPWNSNNTDHASDRGNSSTDQRHRAVFDWLWQSGAGKSNSAVARHLTSGWELSSIAVLASPQPATALVVVNGQQFSKSPMPFLGSLNGSGGWSRVPFLSVNRLYSDPEYTLNARLARSISFSERITGRLSFEAFNLFNTRFDTGVKTIAYTATGGVLTPVSGLGTGNASQGYQSGSNARHCQVALRVTF
jgi:hypothetical protein